MDQEIGVGVGRTHRVDVVGPDARVHMALAVPDVQTAAECPLDVGAEKHVGAKQNLGVVAVLAENVLNDLDGVGRGAAVVGFSLDCRGRVDVHDDNRAWVRRLPFPQLLGRDRVGERAAGVKIWDQNAFPGRQDGRRLGHEVHPARGT